MGGSLEDHHRINIPRPPQGRGVGVKDQRLHKGDAYEQNKAVRAI